MANVETVEASFPVRYLFRRRAIDSGGPGTFRGGTGGELAIVPHKAPAGGLDYVISGKGARHPMSEGLAGGYPGAPNSYLWVHAPEDETGSPPDSAPTVEAIPGEPERVSWGVYPLRGRDALYVRWNGGGGWGDPLERDPGAVARDVREGLVSPEAALLAYGVALTAAGEGDDEATEARRRLLRGARLAPADGPEAIT
jgi:N-methylhydantoinase B